MALVCATKSPCTRTALLVLISSCLACVSCHGEQQSRCGPGDGSLCLVVDTAGDQQGPDGVDVAVVLRQATYMRVSCSLSDGDDLVGTHVCSLG